VLAFASDNAEKRTDVMSNIIEHHAPSTLKPWANNARTHSKKQLRQIADSIELFGFTNPVLIDKDNTILAGHGRVEAAKQLNMGTVPCLRQDQMSDEQKRAYVLADNKLAQNASWDEDLLAIELGAMYELDLDFSLDITGFSISEVDNLIEGTSLEEPGDPADDHLADSNVPQRCKIGDLWRLGKHRLICGDSLDPLTISRLMNGEQARMVFTDPPYNVPIDGHVGNSGKIKHPEFAMASGEMSQGEFINFLQKAFTNMADSSLDGSIHYICMDWRHMQEVMDAGNKIYDEFKNLIIWVKDNGGMGTFYRSRHEMIYAFKKGTAPHVNTFELGQHGRYRTNVWEYKGVNTMRAGRLEELALHPTVKPVQMIADAIKDVSGRGDIVLDIFGGSGSTLIAANKTGRRGYLCELDPIYCDRIIARWETHAHDEAVKIEGPPNPSLIAEGEAV